MKKFSLQLSRSIMQGMLGNAFLHYKRILTGNPNMPTEQDVALALMSDPILRRFVDTTLVGIEFIQEKTERS